VLSVGQECEVGGLVCFLGRDFLRYGKNEAGISKTFAEVAGFQSILELQKWIEGERSTSAMILSDLCGRGYNLSNDPTELHRLSEYLMQAQRKRLKWHRRLWKLPHDKKKWRGSTNE
jgi:hypothetical protein